MRVFVNRMCDSKQKYQVNEFRGTAEIRSPNHTTCFHQLVCCYPDVALRPPLPKDPVRWRHHLLVNRSDGILQDKQWCNVHLLWAFLSKMPFDIWWSVTSLWRLAVKMSNKQRRATQGRQWNTFAGVCLQVWLAHSKVFDPVNCWWPKQWRSCRRTPSAVTSLGTDLSYFNHRVANDNTLWYNKEVYKAVVLSFSSLTVPTLEYIFIVSRGRYLVSCIFIVLNITRSTLVMWHEKFWIVFLLCAHCMMGKIAQCNGANCTCNVSFLFTESPKLTEKCGTLPFNARYSLLITDHLRLTFILFVLSMYFRVFELAFQLF